MASGSMKRNDLAHGLIVAIIQLHGIYQPIMFNELGSICQFPRDMLEPFSLFSRYHDLYGSPTRSDRR